MKLVSRSVKLWSQDAVITLQGCLDCTLWGILIIHVLVLISTLTQLHSTLSSFKMFASLSGSVSLLVMINPGLAGQLRPNLQLRMRHTELAMWPSIGRRSQVYGVRFAELRHGVGPRLRPSSPLITPVRFGGACSGLFGSNRGLLLHLKSALVYLIS